MQSNEVKLRIAEGSVNFRSEEIGGFKSFWKFQFEK